MKTRSAEMAESVPTSSIIGFTWGTVMLKKRRTGPAPSRAAASYSEAGTFPRAAR